MCQYTNEGTIDCIFDCSLMVTDADIKGNEEQIATAC